MNNFDEGWTWLIGTQKWHYFRNKKSLCNKWGLFKTPTEGLEEGNINSPDNCKICVKLLKKEQGII